MKVNQKGFSAVEVVLVVVIVGLIGVVGFMVYKNHNKTTPAKTETTAATTKPTTTQTKDTTTTQPTDKTPETVAAINALINKGDYQGLSAYMATSVTVVKQSTDYDGSGLTATAAAGVVFNYLTKSASSQGADLPWDFSGDTDLKTKAANSSGIIKDYAAQGHIALSANKWVLAYNLDSSLKISSFYMSVSADLVE